MRLHRWTLGASLASLPFILPHVLEDFAAGIAQRVGLSTGLGAFFLGGFLAVQSLGLVLVGRERPAGLLVTFLVGLIWVGGALVEHGPAALRGGLAERLPSALWLGGLLLTQGAAAALAGWAWWRRQRP